MHLSIYKSQKLYKIIISSWVVLMIVSVPFLIDPFRNSPNWFVTVLITLSTLFLSYFWLNGVKDIIYPLWFYFVSPKRYNVERVILKHNIFRYQKMNCKGSYPIPYMLDDKIVDFIYCTYNDFNAQALLDSLMNSKMWITQRPESFRLFILDDSTDEAYKNEIDYFVDRVAKRIPQLPVKVVRREDRKGFKAGNINNWYYSLDKKPDFFIILDSDEVIPSNFVSNTLLRMTDPHVGVVQANHKVQTVNNRFDSTFAWGVESHWLAYQHVKNSYGFLSLLGHGAMVRSEAFERVNGFPHVVAEDLCFSIHIRDLGYRVDFAPEVMCYEEYPIDYFAFKKRHNKWTQGNMEFIKKYTSVILKSKMSIAEKLDILLFTYNLPLSAMFSLYLVINVILFPLVGFDLNYSVILLVPTVLMLIAPLVNDFVYWIGEGEKKRNLVKYSLMAILLYGSMFFISILSSARSMIGSSTFLVTPKTSKRVSVWKSIRMNKGEITFGLSLIGIALILSGSVLPVILIAIPSIASVWLGLLANNKV